MRQMKDSGMEWIGEAPVNWKFKKGKYIFAQRNSKGNHIELQLLSPSQKYGVVPQTLLEELTTQNVVKVKEDTDLMAFKTIHKGDYCISLRSFQGGFEYSRYEGVVSSAYQVFYPIATICDGYYKYLFKDKSFIEKMNSYTISFRDGKNIAFSDFGNTYIPYPPIEEQQKIAEYLDKKCEEIDNLTEDIKAQINTLEQYKKSVITQAVTKGLNPNAKLKDSGLEWIGETPSTWSIMPNKYLMKKLKRIQSIYKGEDIISLTINGVVKRDLDNPSGKMPTSFDGYQVVYPNNLLMCLFDIDVTPRCVGLIKNYGLTSPAYSQFVLNDKANASYYYWYYLNLDFNKDLLHLAKNQRHSLNEEQFGAILTVVPPYEEQRKIAEYLDKKCEEIEECIARKKEQISTLEEYKKSLIFEYVTGKKEIV